MKPRLVILDADAVIHLNEIGRWEPVLDSYEVILPETVALKECRFFIDESGERYEIHIEEYVKQGKIRIESASMVEITDLQRKLGRAFSVNHALHIGEMEAMAVLLREKTRGSFLCTGDTAAVIALCCLDCSEQAISVETLLRHCGFVHSVSRNFTQDELEKKIQRGSLFRITHGIQL